MKSRAVPNLETASLMRVHYTTGSGPSGFRELVEGRAAAILGLQAGELGEIGWNRRARDTCCSAEEQAVPKAACDQPRARTAAGGRASSIPATKCTTQRRNFPSLNTK